QMSTLWKQKKNEKKGQWRLPSTTCLCLIQHSFIITCLCSSISLKWTIVQITAQSGGECNFQKIGTLPSTPGLYISRCTCGLQPVVTVQCVVMSMEVAWLRHWCCLLVGSLDTRDQCLLEETTARILANCKVPLADNQK
ncbi:hypothetical protein OTU49_004091, partial [Cherax quadricarinatus]